MNAEDPRQQLREAYGYQCGYRGVHETEVGGELEQDHYRPSSRGGSDDFDNLVYCCPLCNRLKSDFWSDSPDSERRILHPLRDEVARHLREELDGRLSALTPAGQFHLNRLRLNRAQLVDLRLRRGRQGAQESRYQALRQELGRLQRQQGELIELSRRAIDGDEAALRSLREWFDGQSGA